MTEHENPADQQVSNKAGQPEADDAADPPANEAAATEEGTPKQAPPAAGVGEQSEPDAVLSPSIASTGGILAMIGGSLTLVIAAIAAFGADSGALAAARRNHPDWLVGAALCAGAGLFLGAAYTIMRASSRRKRPTARENALLFLAAFFAISGVVAGISATTKREPGRPSIALLPTTHPDAIKVSVTGEGFASDTPFEVVVIGYNAAGNNRLELIRARFSPDQSGKALWISDIDLTRPGGERFAKLLVTVMREGDQQENCNSTILAEGSSEPNAGNGGREDVDVDKRPTCLFGRVPPSP